MSILQAIRREERKLEKQLGTLQRQLNGLRAAARVLGNSTVREAKATKKRVMSAAARAKISKALKQRWATVKSQARKVAA